MGGPTGQKVEQITNIGAELFGVAEAALKFAAAISDMLRTKDGCAQLPSSLGSSA